MIFFVDAPEMNMDNAPLGLLIQDGVVVHTGRALDLKKLWDACEAGKDYIILRGPTVLRVMQKWPARMAYLRLLANKYKTYRVHTGTTSWEMKRTFPLESVMWSDFVGSKRGRGWTRERVLPVLIKRSGYMGSLEPDLIFILSRPTDQGPALEDAKRWRGWFLLCLVSAGFKFDRIGIMGVGPNILSVAVQEHILCLKPRKGIIGLGSKVFSYFDGRYPSELAAHPKLVYGKYLTKTETYVQELRKAVRDLRHRR